MRHEINNAQQEFKQVHSIISFHRNKAYRAINTEIILTNWEVGRYVSQKLQNAEWGAGVVENLVDYLKKVQPDLRGYDRRAIYRMIEFYDLYSDDGFVSTALPQIKSIGYKDNIIVGTVSPQLENETTVLSFLTLVNWSAHLEILSGCKLPEERLFYILLACKERLSVRELRRQIESSVYERSLLGEQQQSNIMKETLSVGQTTIQRQLHGRLPEPARSA